MAKIYFNRLIAGTITFNAIPEQYQDSVKNYGRTWVQNNKLSIEEYESLYKESYQN